MDISALPTRYDVGKASVAAGGLVVTPKDALWFGNAWGDDTFFLPSQPLVPPQRIASANADGTLTLAYPWPGAAAVEQDYEIRFVGIIERSTAQSRRVLEQLGDVKAWYDIIVEDDAARLALESASNPLPAKYRVLVRLDGVIWMKETSTFGDWIGPVEFKGDLGNKGWSPVFGVVSDGARRVLQLAAWVGGEGAAPAGAGKYVGAAGLVDNIAQAIDLRGEGFLWGGAYNAASSYAKGSVVRLNGTSFIASQAVPTGEQPSGAFPPVDTPFWGILASKGQDGTGTGDVVGPAVATAKRLVVFGNSTGKLLAEAAGLSSAEQGQARADIDVGVLAAFRNKLINGDIAVITRTLVTSVAPGATVLVIDRWWITNGTNQTLTFALIGGQTYLGARDIRNGVSLSFAVAPTTGAVTLFQKVEDARTLVNSLSTVSFEALENAWGAATVYLDQNFGAGGSASVTAGGFASSAGAGKKAGTITIPNVVGKTFGPGHCLVVGIVFTPRVTGPCVLTKFSLVKGDATAETDPFAPRHVQQEAALCQRYFQVLPFPSFALMDGNAAVNGAYVSAIFALLTNMRATPSASITWNAGTEANVSSKGVDVTVSTITINIRSTTTGRFYATPVQATLDAEL